MTIKQKKKSKNNNIKNLQIIFNYLNKYNKIN